MEGDVSEGHPEAASAASPSQDDSGASSSWGQWGGWIQQTVHAAKNKSASALEFVKKDINEFTTTMQSDTKTAATNVRHQLNQETAATTSAKMRQGVSSFLGEITKILTIDAEDLEDEPITQPLPAQGIYDRAQARLNAIQLDPGTYLNPPTGAQDEYQKWCSAFNMEVKKGDISELLVANVQVRGLYTQMVPSQVSHADFWRHYYYKVHQLEQDEARKAELMRRAEEIQNQQDEGWDEEDDWGDIAGPSSPPKACKGAMEASRQRTAPPAATKTEETDTPCCETSPEEAKQFYNLTTIDSAESRIPTIPPADNVTTESVTLSESQDTLTVLTGETPSSCDELSASHSDLVPSSDVIDQTERADEQLVLSADETEVKSKEKGDLVVVGSTGSSEPTTVSSDHSSTDGSHPNKAESLDEDWEKDFDIEVTEEDIRAAQEVATRLALSNDGEGEDWEEWE